MAAHGLNDNSDWCEHSGRTMLMTGRLVDGMHSGMRHVLRLSPSASKLLEMSDWIAKKVFTKSSVDN